MTTPWITLDCDIDAHAKMAALPSDIARYGWIRVLLEAKLQRPQGTFASAAHFRHVLGRHGRYVTDYLKAGLLDKDGDRLLVHDWKRHQWASSKAAQRETFEGQIEDKSWTSEGQKEDASRAVSVSVSVPVLETERSPEENPPEPDAAVAFYQRSGQFPSPRILDWLKDLAKELGEDRLASRIDATPMDGRKVPDYLRAVRDLIRAEDYEAEKRPRTPRPKPPKVDRAAIQAELRKLYGLPESGAA